MKKLAIFFVITSLAASYSFADSTMSGASALVVSGSATVGPEGPETPKESIEISDTMDIIATSKHEDDTEAPYTIDVRYPQISGENLSANAELFNRLVNDMIKKSVQQFKNYVKADMPHMQTLPESVRHNTFNINYDINVIKPGNQTIISVRLSIEGMQAGRAHPYHTHQVLNFDLTKGIVLTLKDIFKPKANYLAVFAKTANKVLNSKLQNKWMINDGSAPLAKNYQIWNLEKDGILITFEEYQVAPYVDGPQEVRIPYSALNGLIAQTAPITAF